jgi:hypothetical protein
VQVRIPLLQEQLRLQIGPMHRFQINQVAFSLYLV